MTISRSDADALIKNFDSVVGHIASGLTLDKAGALKACEGLEKIQATLQSAVNATQGIEPYIWGNVVISLQLAIAQRYLHGGR